MPVKSLQAELGQDWIGLSLPCGMPRSSGRPRYPVPSQSAPAKMVCSLRPATFGVVDESSDLRKMNQLLACRFRQGLHP